MSAREVSRFFLFESLLLLSPPLSSSSISFERTLLLQHHRLHQLPRPGPIPFSKTAAAQSIRDPIVGDHERNSKPRYVRCVRVYVRVCMHEGEIAV